MTYADNRELRRQMYMARNTICTQPGERDNYPIVKQIVNLRRQIAQLLGYKTYAEYVLHRRMAQNTENVNDLVEKLLEAYEPKARQEVAEVEALARRLEGDDFQVQPWDFSYYSGMISMQSSYGPISSSIRSRRAYSDLLDVSMASHSSGTNRFPSITLMWKLMRCSMPTVLSWPYSMPISFHAAANRAVPG